MYLFIADEPDQREKSSDSLKRDSNSTSPRLIDSFFSSILSNVKVHKLLILSFVYNVLDHLQD